jgi:acetyl esterase/lipase
MAEVVYTLGQSLTGDDATYFNSTYSSSQGWHNVGRHVTSATGPWSGYRFDLSPLSDVDPTTISAVSMRLVSNTTSANGFDTNMVIEQAPAAAWSNNATDRPREREQANNDTTNPPVRWNDRTAIGAGGVAVTSPDISERVKAALTTGSWNYASDRLGILLGTVGAGENCYCQMVSRDGTTTGHRPQLLVTVTTSELPQTVTPTGVASEETFGVPWTYEATENISYHDGIGSSVRREFKIFTPTTPAPEGGWPIISWTHGGSYYGGSNSPSNPFIEACVTNGWAIVAPIYKFTAYNAIIGNTTTGYTHPYPVQDMICYYKHIIDNAATYNLNPDIFVITGESAGGHIAMEAALFLLNTDRDSFSMVYQGTNTNRQAIYPDLDISQGRTDLPTPKGIFSWAGPVDMVSAFNNGIADQAISVYLGGRPNDVWTPAVEGEGSINEYIEATAGTIFAGRTATRPHVPIGYCQHTDDPLIPTVAGLTQLTEALDAVGYDTSTGSGVVNMAGFSYRSVSYGDAFSSHGAIMSVPNIAFFVSWMTALMNTLETTHAPTEGLAWPHPKAPNVGVGKLWPRS